MAQADAPGSALHGGAGAHPPALPQRVRALEAILVRKGYVGPAALDGIVAAYEHEVGPPIGARVVARAWTDPPFRRALLADATAAVDALGVSRGARPAPVPPSR